MRGANLIAGLLIAVLFFLQIQALAQNLTGSMSGTIVDSSGAVVPKAKVVLKNQNNQTTRETLTNGSGIWSFAAVPVGAYTVTVSASGFNAIEQRDITVTMGASISLPPLALQVGSAKQAVEVVASSEVVVPVDTGQSSQTLSQSMVEELSIVGRDAAELIKIMPGMAIANGLNNAMWNSYTTASNTGPIGSFSANGTQPNGSMTMTADGANLLDPGNQGTQTANINQNQVAEVSILTSAYGAEFAKGPITFQAIGKSGGAQFHGSGYLYARDGSFNAIESFTKSQGKTPPNDSYYYPGGDFGGPVLIPGTKFNKNHDKLFFYTAYEYMKQSPAGNLNSRFLPTKDMMNGNFSSTYLDSLGTAFKNNYGRNHTAVSEDMAPGGIIPATGLDPNSKIYASTFPTDLLSTPAANGANYQFFLGPPQNRWEYRLRGDYNISQNTKLFVSWNTQREGQESPIGIWWSSAASMPYPSKQLATQKSNVYSANLTHVFSPTLTNETVFAASTFINPIMLANPDAVNPDKLGFKMTGFWKNQYTPQLPTVFSWDNSVPGYFTYPYGQPWSAGGKNAFGKLSKTPNVADNLTWLKGKHTLKAGFYWDYARNNQTGGSPRFADMGGAMFENYGAVASGNPLANFVMGRLTEFDQANGDIVADFKYYQYSFYLNDQWKATRRLTLTLGARFEHMGNWFQDGGPGLAVWNPYVYDNTSAAGGWTGLQWHAINSAVPESGFPSRAFFVEPRFGVAYDVFGNGKTVVRGGFGVYRYQFAYNSVSGGALTAPLNTPQWASTWGCCLGWNAAPGYAPGSSATPGIGTGLDGVLQMGDGRTPYSETYNLTVSQRVPWNSVLEVQYSGNQSHDLLMRGGLANQNAISMGTFFNTPDPTTGTIIQPFLPDQNKGNPDFHPEHYYKLKNYQDIQLISHGTYQYYNALITSWQKQTGRVTFTMNYTFGKVLGIRDNETDNGQGNGNTVYPFDIKKNYGVLSYDHTQIFNSAYVINLPKPIKNNALLGALVNGWKLSGITQLQSGAPIQPNSNGDMNAQWPTSYAVQNYLGSNAPNLHVMPKLTCDPRSNLQSGQYFNPACFTPPTGGANGDLVWPYIHGPAFLSSDLTLAKTFAIKERQRVEFRMSAFNFMNHPLKQFNADGGNSDIKLNFGDSTNHISKTNQNGLTTGYPIYTVGRRVIEFMVKYNF